MDPIRPLEPMTPMAAQEPWWDKSLGEPDAVGGQNELKYAFFAKARRLLVQRQGAISRYDTGAHEIYGATQSSDQSNPKFTSSNGLLELGDLKQVTE